MRARAERDDPRKRERERAADARPARTKEEVGMSEDGQEKGGTLAAFDRAFRPHRGRRSSAHGQVRTLGRMVRQLL